MADKTSIETSGLSWDLVYTSHAHNFLSNTPTDNFYEDRPFLRYLRQKKITPMGGQRLMIPLSHGGTAVGGAYGKGQDLNLVDHDPITTAYYDWAYYYEPVVVYFQDEHEAGGTEARLNLVQIKVQDAIQRLMDKISQDICKNGARTDSKHVHSLLEAVPVDPTASAVFGGINSSTTTWWQSKVDASTTFSTGGLDAMRTMFNDTSAGGKKRADLILCSQTTYELYEDAVEATHDITTPATTGSGRIGDLGFGAGMSYKGVPLMWDADLDTPGDRMFFLNSKSIQLVEHPTQAFSMTPFESGISGGQDARVAIVRWIGQLVTNERRTLGLMDNIS